MFPLSVVTFLPSKLSRCPEAQKAKKKNLFFGDNISVS